MKATAQYVSVVLFITLNKAVLTVTAQLSPGENEILKCDRSSESCRAVLSRLVSN